MKTKILQILNRRYLYLLTKSNDANFSLGLIAPKHLGVYDYPKTGLISTKELAEHLFEKHETRKK